MKRFLLTLTTATTLLAFAPAQPDKTVYVCDTKGAAKWHGTRDCSGLKSCKGKIITMTRRQANDRSLTKCGLEK